MGKSWEKHGKIMGIYWGHNGSRMGMSQNESNFQWCTVGNQEKNDTIEIIFRTLPLPLNPGRVIPWMVLLQQSVIKCLAIYDKSDYMSGWHPSFR
jgi:hypothetical protein